MSQQVSSFGGALLFFAFLLLTIAVALVLLIRFFRGQSPKAPVRVWLIGLAAYVLLLCGSGLASHGDIAVAPGVEKCFDDWCISVVSAQALPGSAGDTRHIAVTLRIANHAARQAMSGSQPAIELVDDQGRRYMSLADSPLAAGAPLDVRLNAGQSALSKAVFAVPADASGLAILVREGPPFLFLIAGEERSPFHGRVLLSLPP